MYYLLRHNSYLWLSVDVLCMIYTVFHNRVIKVPFGHGNRLLSDSYKSGLIDGAVIVIYGDGGGGDCAFVSSCCSASEDNSFSANPALLQRKTRAV